MLSEEWRKFLQEQFPTGSRVVLREAGENNLDLSPGTEGTLKEIDEDGGFQIELNGGATASFQIGRDAFSVLPPKPQMLKLYMPLYADMLPLNEYGDVDEDGWQMNGEDLLPYHDRILAALVKERMPEEAVRGLMHWYDKNDGVDHKVRSVVFTAEKRENRLWGVAECQVAGVLSPDEMDTLKDYITGQASDGWGEGFEQREIRVDQGEMYVHLWGSDDWSLQTEEERFGHEASQRPTEQMGGMTFG